MSCGLHDKNTNRLSNPLCDCTQGNGCGGTQTNYMCEHIHVRICRSDHQGDMRGIWFVELRRIREFKKFGNKNIRSMQIYESIIKELRVYILFEIEVWPCAYVQTNNSKAIMLLHLAMQKSLKMNKRDMWGLSNFGSELRIPQNTNGNQLNPRINQLDWNSN